MSAAARETERPQGYSPYKIVAITRVFSGQAPGTPAHSSIDVPSGSEGWPGGEPGTLVVQGFGGSERGDARIGRLRGVWRIIRPGVHSDEDALQSLRQRLEEATVASFSTGASSHSQTSGPSFPHFNKCVLGPAHLLARMYEKRLKGYRAMGYLVDIDGVPRFP